MKDKARGLLTLSITRDLLIRPGLVMLYKKSVICQVLYKTGVLGLLKGGNQLAHSFARRAV